MESLHRPFLFQNTHNRLKQNLKIQPHIPIRNILRIQLHHFLEICNLASAAYLPHAGDSGFDGETGAVVEFVFFPFVECGWAGAYQGHVAFQDIEELGEFIQAGFADEVADSGFLFAVGQDLIADDTGIEVPS